MMIRYTMSGWKTTTATRLLNILPLQTYSTAMVYVEAYLSSVGGWVPDLIENPGGEGEPANGQRPEEAAVSIRVQRSSTVYRIKGKVTVELDYDLCVSMPPNLSDEDALHQSQIDIRRVIDAQIGKSNLKPGDIIANTGSIGKGIEPTAAERVSYHEKSLLSGQDTDPLVIALKQTRLMYSLDQTWNINEVYTEPEQPIVVTFIKYTDSSYTEVAQHSQRKYVVIVNPTDYKVSGGVVGTTI